MRHIPTSIIFLIAWCILSSQARAADFSTSINTVYTLTPNQLTAVAETITITNQSDIKFPTSYEILVPSKIKNLKVLQSNGGSTRSELTSLGNGSKISLTFTTPIVGKGKSQIYTVEYQNPDIIISDGKNLEAIIPPPFQAAEETERSVTIIVSAAQCPTVRTVPTPTKQTTEGDLISVTFLQMKDQAIFLGCQDTRYVSANLTYALNNTNMTPIETQITLPPDTAYQQCIFDSIDPEPLNLTTDNDGNHIATYKLEPKETKQIVVQARMILSRNFNPIFIEKTTNKAYLAERPFWPIHDGDVKKLTDSLTTPKSIYDYINRETRYDSNNHPDRLGGSAITTSEKSFTSLEYVDSLVTLLRAKGIMSRRLVGFSESTNQNLRPQTFSENALHIWADYYDESTNTWIEVDPTWEKTASTPSYFPIQDLSHIVLTINGQDDSFPYATGNMTIQDVDPFDIPFPLIEAKLSPSSITLFNRSNTTIYKQKLELYSHEEVVYQTEVSRLPMRNQVIIPIKLAKEYDNLTLKINGQTINYTSQNHSKPSILTITGILAAIASVIAAGTGRLLVLRRSK